jgi:integral membrane protein
LDADDFRVGLPETGINLTSIVLIVHGWLYVAYLYTDFRLWSLLRWSLWRFLLIAAGGVVPFLSFFAERHYSKVAEQELKELELKEAQ